MLSPGSSRGTRAGGIRRNCQARLGCYHRSLGQGLGQRMGQTVNEGGQENRSGPSRAAEGMVAILVPPACREEVLGDLHERYRSPGQYCCEALCTVPFVILSRIRRTTDPPVLLMQALGLSVCFLGSAWFQDNALLR